MSVIDMEALREEIDRRRRELVGKPRPLYLGRPKERDRDEVVASAQALDFPLFARIRLSCYEASPIDLDLHAAEIVLTLNEKTGPAAQAVGAGATGPDRSHRT